MGLFNITSSHIAANPILAGLLVAGPLVVGVLLYIYAFCSQRHKMSVFGQSLLLSIRQKERELRGVQNTHPSLFTLLVMDAMTAIFGITAVILLLTCCDDQQLALLIIVNIWVGFRWLSLSQHLITSLISILFLYDPNLNFFLRTIGKILYAVPFILVMIAFRTTHAVLIGVDIFNFLMIIAIVVSCMLNVETEMAKQRKPFGLLAVSLYLLVCLPNTVFNCLELHSLEYVPLSVDVLYATNFYFIMNAELFYLVLKIKEEEQQYEGAIRCD